MKKGKINNSKYKLAKKILNEYNNLVRLVFKLTILFGGCTILAILFGISNAVVVFLSLLLISFALFSYTVGVGYTMKFIVKNEEIKDLKNKVSKRRVRK